MSKRKSTKSKLLTYIDLVLERANRKESVTSHIFLTFLTEISRIPPTRIIPQGTSKSGQIDYIYFPAKSNSVVLFELKKYGSIKQDASKLTKQEHKYLYNSIADLNILDKSRLDNERFLITTDLLTTFIKYRSKKNGNVSNCYTIDFSSKDCYDLFIKFRSVLKDNNSLSKIKSTILISDSDNLRRVCLELIAKNKEIFNSLLHQYSNAANIKLQGPGKARSKFKAILKSILLNHNNHLVKQNLKNIVIKILNRPSNFNKVKSELYRIHGLRLTKGRWISIYH